MFALIPFQDKGNTPEKRSEAKQVQDPFTQFFPEDGNGPELFYWPDFSLLTPNWNTSQTNAGFFSALLLLYKDVIKKVYVKAEDYTPDGVDYVKPPVDLGSCYRPTMSLGSLHRIR